MILLVLSFVCVWLLIATQLWIHRAMKRGLGAPRCGGCKHTLAPGQTTCPECGREWRVGDPGSAGLLPRAADALERRRRTALVQQWLIGAATLVFAAAGTIYMVGLLPSQVPTNASWAAFLGHDGNPAPIGGRQLAVEVAGFAPDVQAYDRRRFMQHVNRVQFSIVVPQEGEPDPRDARAALQDSIATFELRREDSVFLVFTRSGSSMTDTGWRVRADGVDAGTESVINQVSSFVYPALQMQPQHRKIIHDIICDVIDPKAQAEGKAIERAVGGGYSHYIMPEYITRRESIKQQSIAGGVTLAVVGAVIAGLWIRVRVTDSKRKPWGNSDMDRAPMLRRASAP